MPAAANLTGLKQAAPETVPGAAPGAAELFAALVGAIAPGADAPAPAAAPDAEAEGGTEVDRPEASEMMVDASVLLPMLDQQRAASPAAIAVTIPVSATTEATVATEAASNGVVIGQSRRSETISGEPPQAAKQATDAVREMVRGAPESAAVHRPRIATPDASPKATRAAGLDPSSAGATETQVPNPRKGEAPGPLPAAAWPGPRASDPLNQNAAAPLSPVAAPGASATATQVEGQAPPARPALAVAATPAPVRASAENVAAVLASSTSITQSPTGKPSRPTAGDRAAQAPQSRQATSPNLAAAALPPASSAPAPQLSPLPAAVDQPLPEPAALTQPGREAAPATPLQPLTASQITFPAAAAQAPAQSLGAALANQVLDLARGGEWVDQLARDISRSAAADGTMRFRLAPETLGELRVEITHSERGAHVRLHVTSEAAQQALAEAQPKLVQEARAQGVRIAEAEVSLSGGGHSQGREASRQAPSEQPNRGLRGAIANETSSGERGGHARPGRTDLYA